MRKVTASYSKYASVSTAITWRGESTACLSIDLASFQAETSGRLAQWLSTCTMGTQEHVGSDSLSNQQRNIIYGVALVSCISLKLKIPEASLSRNALKNLSECIKRVSAHLGMGPSKQTSSQKHTDSFPFTTGTHYHRHGVQEQNNI